jgi:hypothetical protein
MAKTWQEKFETNKVEQIKILDTNFADMKAGDLMLVASIGRPPRKE